MAVVPALGLSTREQLAAMWFGPKGFASVVYGLLVLEAAVPAADEVFHLVALTIVLSILAHSSTDILVARTFDRPAIGTLGWRGTLRHRRGGDGHPEEASP